MKAVYRIPALLLAVLFCLLPVKAAGEAWENPFSDVREGSWYYGAVQCAHRQKLFSGVAPGRFSPNGAMTRGMFVTVLANLAGVEPACYPGTHFLDVEETAWYAPAVEWAAGFGLVSGVGNYRFAPDRPVTREQMAAILYRFAGKTGNSLASSPGALAGFPDAGEVSAYAVDGMRWAAHQKLMVGNLGRLEPKGSATRAQVATVLCNAAGVLENREVSGEWEEPPAPPEREFDVVVYGGGLPGVFAALQAARGLPSKQANVALVVPVPKTEGKQLLGGIMSSGGLNYWDDKYDAGHFGESAYLVQQGSYARLKRALGNGFSTGALDAECKRLLTGTVGNVEIFYNQDVSGLDAAESGKLTAVSLRPIDRDAALGSVVYVGERERKIAGRVFVDASEEGRLVRMTGNSVTVGRYDWPEPGWRPEPDSQPDSAESLESSAAQPSATQPSAAQPSAAQSPAAQPPATQPSAAQSPVTQPSAAQPPAAQPPAVQPSAAQSSAAQPPAPQQAATLMVKMKQVHPEKAAGDMSFLRGADGEPEVLWGGAETYRTSPEIRSFNERFGPEGFVLKPVNAARNGRGSGEWWVNAFLIFNVDGRANDRDRGTAFFPELLPGSLTTDEAWRRAVGFLSGTLPEYPGSGEAFLAAIRRVPGFEEADFVRKTDGTPVVGDVLYLRETVHTARDADGISHGSEENYSVSTRDVQTAGSGSTTGGDAGHYETRIGLGYYDCDLHPFVWEDLKDGQGNYLWNYESYTNIREDAVAPPNPVYLPYDVLLVPGADNLLAPGYGAGISAYAWGELRVFSNLGVLGDAAGAAAAYSVKHGKDPARLDGEDIRSVQALLKEAGARLEKAP